MPPTPCQPGIDAPSDLYHIIDTNGYSCYDHNMRASLNISLPEELRDWIDAHVAKAGYSTTSEYFRHLVREDQQRQLCREIDAKLLAALDSGDSVEMTSEWWEQRRKELTRRAKAPKATK